MRIGGIPFEKLDTLNINALLFEEIYESIEIAQNSSELENKFNAELICIRENIKILSKETVLTNGLVLSAPSVLDRIASYQKKEIARFRKKEKQTERTIVQYLTRIATKTSPFSTFTQIGLAEIKEQSSLIENAKLTSNQSFVRINNYILKRFKDSIVQNRTLVQGLRIVVNSTLTRLENGYEFLVNDNNIEVFQTMDDHPVVQLILDKLELDKRLLLSTLVKKLLEEVDAEIEDIENFVLELHEIGFLEFEISVSNLDANWELKCLDLLSHLPKCPLSEDWTKLLFLLQETKQKYPRLHPSERRVLLKKAFISFNGLFEEINQGIQQQKQTFFKKQFDHQLTFNTTNLLYEDNVVQTKTSLSKKHIKALLNKLNAFVKTLEPFQRNDEIEILADFFKENYNDKIDLLTFYKAFAEWKLSNHRHTDPENNFQKWKPAFKKTIVIENEMVHIEIKNLQATILNTKEKQTIKSHSAFVQLYQNENGFQCFLNAAMPGYGKYFSRFLYLFPTKVTEQLQERNNRENRLFAEINDASFFNANIHPPLMPFEIKLLDGNTPVSEKQSILLKEIDIALIDQELKLIHRKTGKEIIPFDLGFLALDARSELFKLLSHFSEATFSPIHQIINIVNDQIDHQNTIQIFPRIIISV